MSPRELLGRRVKVLAWYDHVQLIAARPKGDLVGTVSHVTDYPGDVSVTVQIDGPDEKECTLKLGDVEVLP